MVWQDPPDRRTRRAEPRQWLAEAAALKTNPKRWALLRTAPTDKIARGWASQARIGAKFAFRPAEAWEFKTSGCDIYARYVGED